MVDVAKWTFAAARMACASDSVIQSAAEGIGQSAARARVFDDGSAFDEPGFDGDGDPFDDPLAAGVAGTGGVASERSLDESDSFDVSLSDEGDPFSEPPSSPPPDDAAALTAARRSFFAQPEPL
jgi:hypothetical protein